MHFSERVHQCSIHYQSIAICGFGEPPLCKKCVDDGYYIESIGFGYTVDYSVKKRPNTN